MVVSFKCALSDHADHSEGFFNKMSTFRVRYFQHIKDEGPGSPESWLKQRQAIVTTTAFFSLAEGDADIALP